MKKVILMFVAMLAATTMFAQKGGLWLGGGLGFSTNTHRIEGEKSDRTTEIKIAPFAEYYLMEDISLFAGVDYKYIRNKSLGSVKNYAANNIFGFFVGGAKYFSLGEKWNIYAAARIGFDAETNSSYVAHDVDGDKDKATNFNIVIYPGVTYKFADNIVIFAELGETLAYNKHTTKDAGSGNKSKYSSFKFDLLGGGVNFGVKFKFM